MANVTDSPQKKAIRRALVNAATSTLEKLGWTVSKVKGAGKGRVRRITKGGKSRLAVIRTTQDTWIAFSRDEDDSKWVTLADVDLVVAVSVDDMDNPKFAQVHLIEAEEMLERFDRAYAARRAAGHTIEIGRGLWISLYHEDGQSPVNRVGAGVGLLHPPVARLPLVPVTDSDGEPPITPPLAAMAMGADAPDEGLTIAEAKIAIAKKVGVHPSKVTITIEF